MDPHLAAACADYLAHRRVRGYALRQQQLHIEDFLAWLWRHGITEAMFTTADVLAWVLGAGDYTVSYQHQRLGAIRGYAGYCAHRGLPVQPLSPAMLPPSRSRRIPHIYTPEQLDTLVSSCPVVFHNRHVATTMATIITLLAVTGLRGSEVVNICPVDLDDIAGTLMVRAAKNGPTRLLPLHTTTLAALRDYQVHPARVALHPVSDGPLFVSTRGTGFAIATIRGYFARVRRVCGLASDGVNGPVPCLHDLRHTFATRQMIRAYTSNGEGWTSGTSATPAPSPSQMLGLLANWLGHSDPAHTYWYLQAVPELLALAAARRPHLIPPPQPFMLPVPLTPRADTSLRGTRKTAGQDRELP